MVLAAWFTGSQSMVFEGRDGRTEMEGWREVLKRI
jgi:hypothetical protein